MSRAAVRTVWRPRVEGARSEVKRERIGYTVRLYYANGGLSGTYTFENYGQAIGLALLWSRNVTEV